MSSPAIAVPPGASRAGETRGGFWEEAHDGSGTPRAHYAAVLAELAERDLAELAGSLARSAEAGGVAFRGAAGLSPFRFDAVPRIIPADEWQRLAAGLAQRVRALDRFVADAYGAREICAAGIIPQRVLDGCDHFDRAVLDLPAPRARIPVAGLDVVRDADGEYRVLEDNVRTPSGLAYAVAARETVDLHLPGHLADDRREIHDGFALLMYALRAASPRESDSPSVVLLSDGPASSAWYEHERLARELRVPVVTLGQLEVSRGRLHARVSERRAPVDVVYRRTDEDRLSDPSGRLTPVGRALIEPLRRGTVACVNAFGAGVADDKLVHAYVEDMVRFYLGEEPLLRSVPTYDLAAPDVRAGVLSRLEEVVIKPRTGHGGNGVVIGPRATAQERARTAVSVGRAPHRYVAQETVALSRHPTIVGAALEPRHVDLRPFVFLAGERASVLPGGLTRFAARRGSLVVNSSQDGGGKDTWVLR
ncbi:MAG TPA: circularly permuted type 2 ATP-grasp protein [Solirubrobacteraceae bacterium]